MADKKLGAECEGPHFTRENGRLSYRGGLGDAEFSNGVSARWGDSRDPFTLFSVSGAALCCHSLRSPDRTNEVEDQGTERGLIS